MFPSSVYTLGDATSVAIGYDTIVDSCLPAFSPLGSPSTGSLVSVDMSWQQSQESKPRLMSHEVEEADSQKLCLVCGDLASGQHYGVSSCEACKAFFKRTVQGRIQYTCLADGSCEMTKKRRKSCPACRFNKCLTTGMNPDGIRLDRRKGGRHKISIDGPVGRSTADTFDGSMLNGSPDGSALLERLLQIQPGKLYSKPDNSCADVQQRLMLAVSRASNAELMMHVRWAKHIPGFSSLSMTDQIIVIQSSWMDVMCINLAFRSSPYNGNLVVAEDLVLSEKDSLQWSFHLELDSVARRLAKQLTELQLTVEEFILMKAAILLNVGVPLEDLPTVQDLRDRVFDALFEYEQGRLRNDPCSSSVCGTAAAALRRIGRLMLMLAQIREEVIMAHRYWSDMKQAGAIDATQLLSEMLENTILGDTPSQTH